MRSSLIGLATVLIATAHIVAQGTYAQVADIKIGGPLPAQWDYLLADGPSKRLYVSHNAEVVVMGVSCGAIGAYVVVRRLAFIGDAISHAVFCFDPKDAPNPEAALRAISGVHQSGDRAIR